MPVFGTIPTNNAMPSSGYSPVRGSLDPNDPNYLKKLALVGALEGHHELASEPKPQAPTGSLGAINSAPSSTRGSQPQVRRNSPGVLGEINTAPPGVNQAHPTAPARPDTSAAPDIQTGPRSAPTLLDVTGKPLPTGGADYIQGVAKPKASILGKIGHGLEIAGNIAGDVFAPESMALIPGTQLYKERVGNEKFKQNLAQEGAQAKTAEGQADLVKAQADWLKTQNPNLDIKTTEPDTNGQVHVIGTDPRTGNVVSDSIIQAGIKAGAQNQREAKGVYTVPGAGNVQVYSQGGKLFNASNDQPIPANAVPYQKPATEKEDPIDDLIGGKPVQDQNGQWTFGGKPFTNKAEAQKAYGSAYENAKKSETPQPYGAYQVVNQAKQDIAKSSDDYTKAAAERNELADLITAGQKADPNQIANSVANLAGGLMIPTAAGVHRVNEYEMRAWAGNQGLSWANEVNKWLDKGTKGAVPASVAQAWQNIVDVYNRRSYAAYLTQAHIAAANAGLDPAQVQVSNQSGDGYTTLDKTARDSAKQAPKGAITGTMNGKKGYVLNGEFHAL